MADDKNKQQPNKPNSGQQAQSQQERHAELARQLDAQQKVVGDDPRELPPGQPPKPMDWVAMARDFVQQHHWELQGSDGRGREYWKDPLGSLAKGELRLAAELPLKDNPNETQKVHQLHLPPAPWDYTLEDAYMIQRQRNAAGGVDPSPLDRLYAMERARDALQNKMDQVCLGMQELVKGNIPDKNVEETKRYALTLRSRLEALVRSLGWQRELVSTPNGPQPLGAWRKAPPQESAA